MVFLDALQALFALDIGFFIDVLMGNILWAFLFYAIMYIYTDGKHTLYFFLLFTAVMWAYIDFEKITGIVWSAASFILIYYVTKLAVIAIAEKTPALKSRLFLVSEVQFLSLMLAFTFFMK